MSWSRVKVLPKRGLQYYILGEYLCVHIYLVKRCVLTFVGEIPCCKNGS